MQSRVVLIGLFKGLRLEINFLHQSQLALGTRDLSHNSSRGPNGLWMLVRTALHFSLRFSSVALSTSNTIHNQYQYFTEAKLENLRQAAPTLT
jgi:hypothetical protein